MNALELRYEICKMLNEEGSSIAILTPPVVGDPLTIEVQAADPYSDRGIGEPRRFVVTIEEI